MKNARKKTTRGNNTELTAIIQGTSSEAVRREQTPRDSKQESYTETSRGNRIRWKTEKEKEEIFQEKIENLVGISIVIFQKG